VRRATRACTEVSVVHATGVESNIWLTVPGIGPKVTQSVITAAFLFAFKDALYAYTIAARKKIAARR
jgi:hypothetical protein